MAMPDAQPGFINATDVFNDIIKSSWAREQVLAEIPNPSYYQRRQLAQIRIGNAGIWQVTTRLGKPQVLLPIDVPPEELFFLNRVETEGGIKSQKEGPAIEGFLGAQSRLVFDLAMTENPEDPKLHAKILKEEKAKYKFLHHLAFPYGKVHNHEGVYYTPFGMGDESIAIRIEQEKYYVINDPLRAPELSEDLPRDSFEYYRAVDREAELAITHFRREWIPPFSPSNEISLADFHQKAA